MVLAPERFIPGSVDLDQIGGGKLERLTDPGDVVQRDIRLGALDMTYESAMHLSPVRELLLAQAKLLAPCSHVIPEDASEVRSARCCHSRAAFMRSPLDTTPYT